MPTSSFALPSKREGGKGGYPIPDASHARNALARVAQHGTPAEKAKVRAKVHAKFPTIGKKHEGGLIEKTGPYEMEKGEMVIPAKGHAYEHEEVCAPSNTPEATGCGHWEMDGYDVKFVKD